MSKAGREHRRGSPPGVGGAQLQHAPKQPQTSESPRDRGSSAAYAKSGSFVSLDRAREQQFYCHKEYRRNVNLILAFGAVGVVASAIVGILTSNVWLATAALGAPSAPVAWLGWIASRFSRDARRWGRVIAQPNDVPTNTGPILLPAGRTRHRGKSR